MANYGYNWLYDLIMHHNQQYGYGFSWDINGVNIMGHTGILYFDVNDNEHDMKFECVLNVGYPKMSISIEKIAMIIHWDWGNQWVFRQIHDMAKTNEF